MKFSYTRTLLFVSLVLPLNAQARRHKGRPVVVTVYEEAAPVYVTSTAALDNGPDGVVLASPTPSVMESLAPDESVTPVEDQEDAVTEFPPQPTLSPPANGTVIAGAPTPKPEPATATVQEQGDAGSSGASLTISVTNLYGTPLSIGVGSNYGGPTPDGNPQPTSITSSIKYTFPIGWAGRIWIGKSWSGCNSLIEASYEPHWARAVDVSYVDGYSVPITCSVDDVAVTGCNLELFDQGIECDSPLEYGACPNSARSQDYGPAAPFFAPCQGSAYTYPHDDTATNGGITGLEISCCIGTSCPTPVLQKSQKRDRLPNPFSHSLQGSVSKRESGLDRSQHLHQHQERHHMVSPRSHVHRLVQDAKLRR